MLELAALAVGTNGSHPQLSELIGEAGSPSPEAAGLIANAAPEGRTGVVEGAAHWCAIEDPDATNDVLFGFLDQLVT